MSDDNSAKGHYELPELIPYRKGDKWGYCDRNKKLVTPVKYDHAEPLMNFYELARVNVGGKYDKRGSFKGGKFGFIDNTGKEVIPLKYSDWPVFQKGLAKVNVGGRYKIAGLEQDYKGRWSFMRAFRGGKWGYVDTTGNEVLPPKYNSADRLQDKFIVADAKHSCALISKDGEKLLELNYERARFLTDKLIIVGKKMGTPQLGLVDITGKEILPQEYQNIHEFSGKRSVVLRRNKLGCIDMEGNLVVRPKYDDATCFFCDGMLNVGVGAGPWDRLTSGREVPSKWGYIDIHGDEIIPLKFDYACPFFGDGLARVFIGKQTGEWGTLFGGKCGYVDKSGNEVVPLKYEPDGTIGKFKEGFVRLRLNQKFGFVDKTGKEICNFIYDDAQIFHEGFAAVKRNDRWGYIEASGTEVIPLQYDAADSFKMGYSTVKQNGKAGVIDKNGIPVIDFMYEEIYSFNEKLIAPAKKNGKWGFINIQGNTVIPFKYDSVEASLAKGLIKIKYNDKPGYIDIHGMEYFDA